MSEERPPVIDISPLLSNPSSSQAVGVAHEIQKAFSEWGFFQIIGHNVPSSLQTDLHQCAADFFAQPEEKKLALDVQKGGAAWRGVSVHLIIVPPSLIPLS